MSQSSETAITISIDPVSNVLKWVLLIVAIASFALFAWATVLTYERAPPQPDRLITLAGRTLMTSETIVAGKAGFQKADLMDYGSLYGMGSYYGQDYTAWTLIRLAGLAETNLAQANFGKAYNALSSDQQAAVRDAMRKQLQQVDLTQRQVTIPDALAAAIVALRGDMAKELGATDLDTGWTPAYSLSQDEKAATADFLIYCALTTVARRPDVSWSWTENWPYEPEVGNTPTTNTFVWTWASFCFTFLAFGVVLFIYEFWLNHPDDAPMDPVLARFGPLTESQRKVGKYLDLLMARHTADTNDRTAVRRAMDAANRGVALIQSVMGFIRERPLDPQIVDLNHILSISMLDQITGSQINLVRQPAPYPTLVKVDQTQLELALLNVALNARDAMPNGGTLTIRTHLLTLEGERGLAGDYAALTIRDTGTGMAPDVLENVFTPFFTTKTEVEGTGLGLSMVDDFVKKWHGAVAIDSVVGKGTEVTIFLPTACHSCEFQSTCERGAYTDVNCGGSVLSSS